MTDDKNECKGPPIGMMTSLVPKNQGVNSVYIGRSVLPHDKVYEKPLPVFSTYDHSRPWICRTCGKEGFDIVKKGGRSTEYQELKLKFKDKS